MGLFSKKQVSSSSSNYGITNTIFMSVQEAFGKWFSNQGTSIATVDTMLSHSAAYAAIRVRSAAIGGIKFNVYMKTPKGKQLQLVTDVWRIPYLLQVAPNGYQTPAQFFGQIDSLIQIKGNAFINVEYDDRSSPKALHIIDNSIISRVYIEDGEKYYEIHDEQSGETYTVPQSSNEIIHLYSCTLDGLMGISPLEYLNNTICNIHNSEVVAKNFLQNSQNPGVILNVPIESKLSAAPPETIEGIKEEWKRNYGMQNSGKPAVLRHGLKAETLAFSAKDTQMLESRQYNIYEISRIFGVPPNILGDDTKTGSYSIEITKQQFLQFGLNPTLIAIEQGFMALIKYADQGTYFIEADRDGFLSSDAKTKHDIARADFAGGLLQLNEAREILGLNEVDGGDMLLVAQNQSFMRNGIITPASGGKSEQ